MSVDQGVAGAISRESKAASLPTGETDKIVTLRVFRGDREGGRFHEYPVPLEAGMVVLDAVHRIQARVDGSLACRWNCKAGKCGSCSAEINGVPRLMCMTRVSDYAEGEPIVVGPMKAFPIVKDLVTDVSWNYDVNKRVTPFTPREMTPEEAAHGEFKMQQADIDRVQEFRKCIECFLCQDVCHVLRTHQMHDRFVGPRFLVRYGALEMHPTDRADRADEMWREGGIGLCNITKCCTEVCPEHITITDNAIIPLKERVVSRRFDPLAMLIGKLRRKA